MKATALKALPGFIVGTILSGLALYASVNLTRKAIKAMYVSKNG